MKLKSLILYLCLCTVLLFSHNSFAGQNRGFGQVLSDEWMTLSLKTKFMKDKQVPANDIKVSVYQGTVSLKGELTNQEQINRAIEIAEQQKGVREVKAHLVLKEFAELRETDQPQKEKKSFFKNLFKGSGSSDVAPIVKNGNAADLNEKDLTDPGQSVRGKSVLTQEQDFAEAPRVASETPRMKRQQVQPIENEDEDDLDAEEEF